MLWSVKKIGPTIGTCESPGTVTVGSSEVPPAFERPSPSTRARPTPTSVSARPLTTWSAWKWMVMTPWRRLSRPPASMATSSPSHGLPVDDDGREAGHRADEHHALDAQVQDPGALGEDLADGREEVDGAGRHARRQDRRRIHQTARRRTNRIV